MSDKYKLINYIGKDIIKKTGRIYNPPTMNKKQVITRLPTFFVLDGKYSKDR